MCVCVCVCKDGVDCGGKEVYLNLCECERRIRGMYMWIDWDMCIQGEMGMCVFATYKPSHSEGMNVY